jgi:hypothetical protein
MGVIVIILITFFVSVSSYLSSGEIYNKDQKIFFKRITKRGYIFGITNLLIVILTVGQYFINLTEVQNTKKESDITQTKRDSILKSKYDSTSLNIIKTFVESLAKNYLKLDSNNQKLIKIVKDSSKTKVIVQNDPVLCLCPTKSISKYYTTQHEQFLCINICSEDATSTGFKINTGLISENSQNECKLVSKNPFFIDYDDKFSKDSYRTYYINWPKDTTIIMLYFIIQGNYSNSDNSKLFLINDVHFYNLITNTSGLVVNKRKHELLILFRKWCSIKS